MKILILLLIFPAVLFPQDIKKLTIQIRTSNISDSSVICIAGNIPEFGNWSPNKIPLNKISKNIWEKSFLLKSGQKIEYKITRGSWNTEAVNENGKVPSNSTIIINQDTIIYMEIAYWKDQFEYNLPGKVTGRLDYYKNVKGEGILPRDILVWLPPDYDSDTTARYPVLYMQDGQNLFNPETASFGVDWQLDETADSLIKEDIIQPLIIVGLTCTDWRSEEYADTDTGFSYMNFIISKVKPFIDSKYRTLKGAENNAVGGSSLGSLISFMLVWNYPDVFSMSLCMSSAFKINSIDYVKNVDEYNGPFKQLKFYFDVGNDSLDARLKPGTLAMIDALKNKGYKKDKDILFFEDKNGKHNEASWGRRVNLPLQFFFGTSKNKIGNKRK